jgi:3-dehydroquinate synthase
VKTSHSYPFFGPDGYDGLDALLQELAPSKTFLLVDSNTTHCLSVFVPKLGQLDAAFEVLEVPPGEESKSLEVAANLWSVLLEYGADRNSLIINVGGGVVCDLGAFIAATFKRGIPFVNVPTSLLAMVDASVGGKNGINFAGLKNQLGTFTQPNYVLIDPDFLTSLPQQEWESGHAEMLKHALLSGTNWAEALQFEPATLALHEIQKSVAFKAEIVREDFKETGKRKVLNLGHTTGHAWESYAAFSGNPCTHGAAVIQGLHVALLLSGLQDEQYALAKRYPWIKVEDDALTPLWERQLQDKKNTHGEVRYVLLEELGKPIWDVQITREQWTQAVSALNSAS